MRGRGKEILVVGEYVHCLDGDDCFMNMLYIHQHTHTHTHIYGGSIGRESACNVGYVGLIPGSERSPGEGNGNPLQYSCLENLMDGGAW